MEVKVLLWYYTDRSAFGIARIYLEKDFIQAEKDYELMCEHGSDSKNWKLEDVEVY